MVPDVANLIINYTSQVGIHPQLKLNQVFLIMRLGKRR